MTLPSLPLSLPRFYLIDSCRQQWEEGQASVLNGGGHTVRHAYSIFGDGERDGRPENGGKSTKKEEGKRGGRDACGGESHAALDVTRTRSSGTVKGTEGQQPKR